MFICHRCDATLCSISECRDQHDVHVGIVLRCSTAKTRCSGRPATTRENSLERDSL